MPSYRYLTYRMLPALGALDVAELPLYGVYMDKRLSGAGNFTGTFRLDTGIGNDAIMLAGCTPGFYKLAVLRDDKCIWCGPIWSRTYSTDGSTVQITAQTFESVFEHIVLTADFIANQQHQVQLQNLISAIQSVTSQDFYMIVASPVPTTDVNIALSIAGADRRLALDIIQQLVEPDDGINFTFNVSMGAGSLIIEYRIYAHTKPVASTMYYDYPGTISKYWYNENASQGGTFHIAQFSGASAEKENTDLTSTGWPRWAKVRQATGKIDTLADLQEAADRMAIDYKAPIGNPTFELGEHSLFTGWDLLGQTFKIRVQDPRFPDGKVFDEQLVGWSLQPESSDQPEIIRLQLASDTV